MKLLSIHRQIEYAPVVHIKNFRAWAEVLVKITLKQTTGKLKRPNGSYCCLGILAEQHKFPSRRISIPSGPFCEFAFPLGGRDGALWPQEDWEKTMGYIEMREFSAANDAGFTFAEIGEAILEGLRLRKLRQKHEYRERLRHAAESA